VDGVGQAIESLSSACLARWEAYHLEEHRGINMQDLDVVIHVMLPGHSSVVAFKRYKVCGFGDPYR
jgi:hypothetical protein